MLPLDSLVTDLIFQQGATFQADVLIDALGGQETIAQRKMLDPDMHDPRFEMELSPSMPFRRRGERRLMIIDDSVAPMRKNPRMDPLVPIDLRPEMERLIAVCEAMPVRMGRLNALGSWGDAVLVARSARDLRAIALLSWVLDPNTDVDGKRRANRLTQAEFEAKILAYDKRLEELDEEAILANVHSARVERRGDLIILDTLEEDGTWDMRNSLELENELAAVEQFSLMPGAPSRPLASPGQPANQATQKAPSNGAKASSGTGSTAGKAAPAKQAGAGASPAAPPAEPEKPVPPLRLGELAGRVVLIFPPERFDLDVAAAMGKGDYSLVLAKSDQIPGPVRDSIFRNGADFVAPLEFLSEVFIDGKPLSKPEFERAARTVAEGARVLEVHYPRFGPALLIDVTGRGRFITSSRQDPAGVVALITAGATER